jgi:hypothetical protein
MSVAVRLGGFLLLVAVVFLAAFAIGSRLGPVSPAHGGPGGGSGSGGGMHMGAVVDRGFPAGVAGR